MRAISLLGLYIGTSILMGLLIWNNEIWAIALLTISLSFNVYVHTRFENYPSLVFAMVIPISMYLSFFARPATFSTFFIGSLAITFGLTFFGRIIRTPHRLDEYIFQSIAVLLLIGNSISYGWRIGFMGILQFSVLLLMFSVVFFVSYLQIRK